MPSSTTRRTSPRTAASASGRARSPAASTAGGYGQYRGANTRMRPQPRRLEVAVYGSVYRDETQVSVTGSGAVGIQKRSPKQSEPLLSLSVGEYSESNP